MFIIARDEMSRTPPISEINELNHRYWEEQNTLRDRRIANEAIRESAFARLSDEQARGIPVYYQAPIEKLLEDAEREKERFLSQRSRKGGQAQKSDALRQAILDLVRRDLDITEAKLKDTLTRERFPDLIEDVDEEKIWFVQLDGSGRRRSKSALISGLKHRLSRAKKTLKSR
jgi:hypothetical protein